MAPLVPMCLRGRSSSKEPYGPSNFGLANIPRKTNDFPRKRFDRLEDGAADLISGTDPPMNIRQTTNIEISEEDIPWAGDLGLGAQG